MEEENTMFCYKTRDRPQLWSPHPSIRLLQKMQKRMVPGMRKSAKRWRSEVVPLGTKIVGRRHMK